ncbi:hypothetical protein LUZ62_064019 [Rhynchospora pubera]|uniref:Fungal lipase-type domain-containing protein n=1 Tax=Rhynchospora pubera TaxID=906938 RepID=A0AAV8ENT0_9POAL|nr:hypothetical protein LUZ62_064019 [Rhynchospora pubera]
MGTKNMAAAMGTAVLLYLVLSGRLSVEDAEERRLLKEATRQQTIQQKEKKKKNKHNKDKPKPKDNRTVKWPDKAPVHFGQTVGVAARTVRYTWKETLGKWTLGEIAFGIKYFMKQQGNLQHEFTEGKSVQLGHEVRDELVFLLRHLKLCMYFSKKPYKVFMEHGRYRNDDVLVKKCKARLMRPSFTVVRDADTKCFLLLIRGAISLQERLTAATGAAVPFHHVVMHEGVVTDVVLGHAHCGMVVAARWIAKYAVPALTDAIRQHPDYNVKIIGHSMGAGIASILTYMLREHKELSSCTCIAFAPAACMTWELAESGKDFITTLVNRTDLVPAFSKVSAAQLRAEVTVSSWLSDLRDQIQHTRFLNLVNRSVAFMRSHVPFVSHPHSKVVDADMLVKPNEDLKEEGTHATEQKKHHCLSCFPCMVLRHPSPTPTSSASSNPASAPQVALHNNNTVITESELISNNSALIADLIAGCSGSALPDTESDSESESELEIIRETKEPESSKTQLELLADANLDVSTEGPQLFPPGRIMHMVVLPTPERDPALEVGSAVNEEELVNVYETPREFYSKIRLARSMIRDHYMPRYIKTLQILIDKFAKPGQEEIL